jgi:hypothetical protein
MFDYPKKQEIKAMASFKVFVGALALLCAAAREFWMHVRVTRC